MVLYFTGTGNSRYLARRIAEGLETPLYDLNACIKAGDTAPVQTNICISGYCTFKPFSVCIHIVFSIYFS